MQFYSFSCYLFLLGRTIFLCTLLLNVPCRRIEVGRRFVDITVTFSVSSIDDDQTRNCDVPSQYVGLFVLKHQSMLVGLAQVLKLCLAQGGRRLLSAPHIQWV